MRRIKYKVLIDGIDCGTVEAHTRQLAMAYVEQHMVYGNPTIRLIKLVN